MLYRSLTKN